MPDRTRTARTMLASVAALCALALPASAFAHRQWLLPSQTTFSGGDAWVTFDAGVSNDLFVANFHALNPDDITVTGPDGVSVPIEHAARGETRATFDVHLTRPGTYRIAMARKSVFGSYMLDGKRHRLPRGTAPEGVAAAIPAGASDVEVREIFARNQTFVTLGVPDDAVFTPTGDGLEMVPVTHPDDLVSDTPGVFRFLIDGKPAAGLDVTVHQGSNRWAATPVQATARTDTKGEARIVWPGPGMYWLDVRASDTRTSVPAARTRALSYAATLEVQAP